MGLQLDKLRPHQVESAKHLLAILQSGAPGIVDESDTGIGKTYVGSAVANAFGRPTLVVVPKIAVGLWERAAQHFNDRFSILGYEHVRTGRTPFGWWDNTPPPGFRSPTHLKCQSCLQVVDEENMPPCHCHPLGIHCVEVKKVRWDYGQWHWSDRIGLVLFDEAHRCNGKNSLNAEMLIACKRQRIPALLLSATLASSPLDMRATGLLLGLHNLVGDHGFYPWLSAHGCGKLLGLPGWRWTVGREKQLQVMSRIRQDIIPRRGVRVRAQDVVDFPEREITAELYDLAESSDTIDRLYEQMAEAIRELDSHAFNDKDPDHPLTKMLRASQKIELLKVPLAVELATDFLDTGYSVVLFVNYTQTLMELRKALRCELFIDSSVTGENRERAIGIFQSNDQRKLIVNSRAGGIAISLEDLDGNFPRAGLAMPTPSAVVMRQLFGRLHRHGGKSKCLYRILLANHTVEQSIFRNLQGKLTNLDALNDADFLPDSIAMFKRSLKGLIC